MMRLPDPHTQRDTQHPQRQRRVRRVIRAARERIGTLRRLLVAAVLLAVASIGVAVFFATRATPEAERDAVLLGRGQAGVALIDSGAAPVRPRRGSPQSMRPPTDQGEQGQHAGSGEASYYGDELRGRPTASGEGFNPDAYTAAHRTLPLGTRLRVTNVRNGESVIVRVNDRGPFSGDRVLDVSKGAARELGMLGSGTAPVRMEVLPRSRG